MEQQVSVHTIRWSTLRELLLCRQELPRRAPRSDKGKKREPNKRTRERQARAETSAVPPAPPQSPDQKFAEALVELRSKMFAYALNKLRDRQKAEDIVQIAQAKAWAARASFQSNTNFHAWIFTILRNEFINTFRGSATAKNTIIDSDLLKNSTHHTSENAETSLLYSEAIVAMSRLAPDFREVTFLALLDGWTYEAIAARLGVSVGTVKSRLWRARAALRSKIA